MKLYILRHAIAQPRRPNLNDSKRRLTAEGVQELKAAVRGLRRLKVRPDRILASPYRRAWDTAVVTGRALVPKQAPVEFDALKPNGSPARIWSELKQHTSARALMLVGHEPLLSEFAAFLLNLPHLSVNLKKSGFIRIDVDAVRGDRPSGVLRWLLTPSQLSRMS